MKKARFKSSGKDIAGLNICALNTHERAPLSRHPRLFQVQYAHHKIKWGLVVPRALLETIYVLVHKLATLRIYFFVSIFIGCYRVEFTFQKNLIEDFFLKFSINCSYRPVSCILANYIIVCLDVFRFNQ